MKKIGPFSTDFIVGFNILENQVPEGSTFEDIVILLDGILSRNTVNNALKNLIEYGMLEKRFHKDTNSMRYYLTEKGERLFADIWNDYKSKIYQDTTTSLIDKYIKIIPKGHLVLQENENWSFLLNQAIISGTGFLEIVDNRKSQEMNDFLGLLLASTLINPSFKVMHKAIPAGHVLMLCNDIGITDVMKNLPTFGNVVTDFRKIPLAGVTSRKMSQNNTIHRKDFTLVTSDFESIGNTPIISHLMRDKIASMIIGKKRVTTKFGGSLFFLKEVGSREFQETLSNLYTHTEVLPQFGLLLIEEGLISPKIKSISDSFNMMLYYRASVKYMLTKCQKIIDMLLTDKRILSIIDDDLVIHSWSEKRLGEKLVQKLKEKNIYNVFMSDEKSRQRHALSIKMSIIKNLSKIYDLTTGSFENEKYDALITIIIKESIPMLKNIHKVELESINFLLQQ